MKFTQPVSMKCSKEQYERDLKEPLLAMGYREYSVTNFDIYPILVSNQGGANNHLANLEYGRINECNRYFVDTYNPSLFLALARMTDSETGNLGEWLFCINATTTFTAGNLYKLVKDNLLKSNAFINDFNELDGWASNKTHFRKATKQEIINHFSNKETTTVMGKVTVKKLEFKPLYDAACSDWKTRFDNVLKSFVFADEIEFTSEFVEEMRSACTAEQKKIFNTIFKELDRNAFIKPIDSTYIASVSSELFGNKFVLEEAQGAACNIDRRDLKGRALYVNSSYEVKLHPTGGGNVIEILKKQ